MHAAVAAAAAAAAATAAAEDMVRLYVAWWQTGIIIVWRKNVGY
jgi:hypothetical protein